MTDPTYFDERGNVICQLCNKPFTVISPTHLKKAHGIKFDTYRAQFPDAPITGEKFSKTMKYVKTDFFKKDEEDDEDELDKLPTVEKALSNDFEDKLKEFISKKPKLFVNESGVVPKDKAAIINFLMGHFDDIEYNYFVEKLTISGHLEYRLITDIVDTRRKINFEFPDAFWHNKDVQKNYRDSKLQSDGWLIVDIYSKAPSVRDVESELKKRNLI
jgi:hypothetical protein